MPLDEMQRLVLLGERKHQFIQWIASPVADGAQTIVTA